MSDWTTYSPAGVDSTSTGAVKWNTYSPAGVNKKRDSYFIIPAGGLTAQTSKTASYVVQHFLYSATKDFTIPRLPIAPVGTKLVPCIRWRTGTTSYRYKLWQNVGELLYKPLLYTSERIGKNFVIEIWMNPGETTVTLASNIVVPISIKYPAVLGNTADVEDNVAVSAIPSLFPQFPLTWSNPRVFTANDYWLTN